MIRLEKVGQTDHYYMQINSKGLSRSFSIHVDYECDEVTHLVIERLDYGTKVTLTVEEVNAIVELAKKLGVVREA